MSARKLLLIALAVLILVGPSTASARHLLRGFGHRRPLLFSAGYGGPGYWGGYRRISPNYWYPYGYHYRDAVFYDGYIYGAPLVLPPIAINAGELYGMRPILDMLDVGVPEPPVQVVQVPVPVPVQPFQAAQQPVQNAPVNWDIRKLALRFFEFGDKKMREGKYHSALQRYKKAEAVDDQLADAYFRQAMAHLGLGKYTRARAAIQEGLDLRPDWGASRFRLSDLFGPHHLEAVQMTLEEWVRKNPLDSDAYFMQGVIDHFTGRQEAALQAFLQSAQLNGNAADILSFLPAEQPEPIPQPNAIQ